MSRIKLIKAVAQKLDVSEDEAGEFVTQMMDTLIESLVATREVELDGFGTFVIKKSQPRTAINIQTREEYPIPAQDFPAFEPADALISAVIPLWQHPTVAAK